MRTLERQPHRRSCRQLLAALAAGDPVLIGDYHPLRRSHAILARILRRLPRDRPLALLLELLPISPPRPAADYLRGPGPPLADGRNLREVYGHCLEALAIRDGFLAGAWLPSGAARRDQVAARTCAQMARALPGSRWVLHFGDWHLAEEHLPARLREQGGRPVVLHLSPEPLWRGTRRRSGIVELGDGHWAWLDTPPLARLLSARAGNGASDLETALEDLEALVEDLAARISGVFSLPPPQSRTSLWPAPAWREFRRFLPVAERRALLEDAPPQAAILHPHLPLVWLDRVPDPNTLLEVAAHTIAVDWPLGADKSLEGRVRARAFHRLVATLANPLLRPSRSEDLCARLFRGATPGSGDLDRQRLLLVERSGALLGARLARELGADDPRLRELLEGSWRPSIPLPATATIRWPSSGVRE